MGDKITKRTPAVRRLAGRGASSSPILKPFKTANHVLRAIEEVREALLEVGVAGDLVGVAALPIGDETGPLEASQMRRNCQANIHCGSRRCDKHHTNTGTTKCSEINRHWLGVSEHEG